MRIALYSPRSNLFRMELAQGGDAIFLHGLLDDLRRRGHEVQIASHLNVRDLWRGQTNIWNLAVEAHAVRRRMRKFRPDAWLIYKPSRSYPDLFGWWLQPKKYVLFSTSTWQSRRMPRRWRSPLTFAYRQALRRADLVTAERPPTFRRLLNRGVEPERLRLLTHAVPVPASTPSKDEARRRLGLPIDVPIALCATRFKELGDSEGKSEMILDLLSVVPMLPDALVVLAGDGPARTRIETEVARLGIGNRVRLVGSVENSDLGWFYAASDLCACPHPADRPWTSLLEAQAHGRPVVTLRTGSGELTVDDGRTGLLADTLDDFRVQLAALLSDRQRCTQMGEAARRFIAEFHSTEVRVREIEEVIAG